MAKTNQVSIEITEAMVADVAEKLNAIRTALAPVLVVNLTPDERMNMLKMGDKTLAFVRRALNFATQNPSLVPSYLNLEEAWKDYKLTEAISSLLKEFATLRRGLEDTAMVAGSEAYDAALVFYASVRGASRSNVPGAQAIHDELKRQFPRRSRKDEPLPPEE